MCPKTHACGAQPWTKSQQDRQGQCHQLIPVTGHLCRTRLAKASRRQLDNKAHDHSADGEKTFSAFSSSPCSGRSLSTVLPTNSDNWIIMSNSSGKRIITTTRQYCLAVLTAHMTPTAQARRKSWYVSASRGQIVFAKARTSKENSRLSRQPFPPMFFEKGNLTRYMAVSVLDWFATTPYHLHRSAQRQLQ